jgi:hypothetical protein
MRRNTSARLRRPTTRTGALGPARAGTRARTRVRHCATRSGVKGLEQVVDDAELIRVERVLRMRGRKHVCGRAGLSHECDAIGLFARELDVHEHDIWCDRLDRFPPVFGGCDGSDVALERSARS